MGGWPCSITNDYREKGMASPNRHRATKENKEGRGINLALDNIKVLISKRYNYRIEI